MNCEAARENLQLYLDGELPREEEATLKGHLEACANCDAALRALHQMVGRLKGLEPVWLPPSFTNGVLARIRREEELAHRRQRRRLIAGFFGSAVGLLGLWLALPSWASLGGPSPGQRLGFVFADAAWNHPESALDILGNGALDLMDSLLATALTTELGLLAGVCLFALAAMVPLISLLEDSSGDSFNHSHLPYPA